MADANTIKWFHSLGVRAVLSQIVLLIFVVSGTLYVIQSARRTALIEENLSITRQLGNRLIATLDQRIILAESLVNTMARIAVAESGGKQELQSSLRALLDFRAENSLIAGGGIWPEPFAFDPNMRLNSTFYGRGEDQKLRLFDDYNDTQGTGYHHESWYVTGRLLKQGDVFWSDSYIDRYSNQPMVTATTPLFRGAQFIGVATVDVSLSGLDEFFDGVVGGDGSYVAALDRNNKFLSFPNQAAVRVHHDPVDSKQQRPDQSKPAGEYLTIAAAAAIDPRFLTVRDALETINREQIDQIQRATAGGPESAAYLQKESAQIDNNEAQLVSALIARHTTGGIREISQPIVIELDLDPLHDESAVASMFVHPSTFWKLVVITPTAEIYSAVGQFGRKIAAYIVGIEFVGLVLMFFVVQWLFVTPIRRITKNLGRLADGSSQKTSMGKGELAVMAATIVENQQQLQKNLGNLQESNDHLSAEIENRVHAEQDLENNRARLKNLLEHAPEAILLLDSPGFRVFEANMNARKLFAHSIQSIRKYDIFGVLGLSEDSEPEQRLQLQSCLQAALDGQSRTIQWQNDSLRGRALEITFSKFPADAAPEIRVSIIDISEKTFLEKQLQQAQKMEAIGQLAGGIAHDFNNLLVSIMGHNEFLRDAVAHSPDAMESIDEIHEAGRRAARLTGQLLAYSRKQILNPQALDLNNIVNHTVSMLERILGENITLTVEYYPTPVSITADRIQMEQVILNLATNARDAMPDGGALLIEVERLPDVNSGAKSILRVTDNGEGMTASVQQHIFEPFFTTKDVGHGTGLGLSSAHGIIKQSGGEIIVNSSPGEGTCFTVSLPERQPENLIEEPESPAYAENVNSEQLMVVEDEEMVASVLLRTLQSAGFQVTMAINGKDALEKLEANDFRPDLILVDVVMPEMDGIELAEELIVFDPDLPILFLTGYTNDHEKVKLLLAQGETILKKPFSPSELVLKVRTVLDSRTEDQAING